MKLKVIKDIEQYNEYCNLHEKLMIVDDENSTDEIELLELLIEDFDNKLVNNRIGELNPVELLKTLLRDANLSQVNFAKSIGISKQLLSDILNYRRNISKELVLKLATYFAMSQTAFSRKYDLVGKSKVSAKKLYSQGVRANS
ncbi:MAG: HTH-type transcriptional regulator/antitoxin HigA [Saprospiraceae bacterium]|jgi:HTH-type transcriptional regulator/antitoxin HigA